MATEAERDAILQQRVDEPGLSQIMDWVVGWLW
jgi:hypothetical protein